MKLIPLILLLISFNMFAECRKQVTSVDKLACAIYFEAGNQDEKGMELVGHVIMNRLHNDSFPNSVDTVLKQKNQFSYWNRKHFKVLYLVPYNKAKIIAFKLLILDYLNMRKDTSHGALFFRVSNKCMFGKKILKHQDHIFCK